MYTTTYDYDTSGRLIHETCVEANTYTGGSTSTRDITYLYDESGIIGAIQKRGTVEETFYFDKNIKGDVIGIFNSSGSRVASYIYDAWGNCTTKTHISNSFSAYNPIRYRGYYYDRETKLYYLNSRYYDPAWRRFISPDKISALNGNSINGLNLYSYANNCPVSISCTTPSSTLITTTVCSINVKPINSDYSSFTPPTLYEILGHVSNFLALCNGLKAAEYLTHIHGNPPPVKWFLDNVSKIGKITEYLGWIAAAVDGINVYIETGDNGLAFWTMAYDLAGMYVASELGGLIGGIIGGPVGAIVGTLAIIAIESLIQNYKEDIVIWIDGKFDSLGKQISLEWRELAHA